MDAHELRRILDPFDLLPDPSRELPDVSNRTEPPVHRFYSPRDKTPLEDAVDVNFDEGRSLVSKLPKLTTDKERDEWMFRPSLDDCIFCGHTVTDLDSIAGAVGAADLYGGTPGRSSELNSETKFALEWWKCDVPESVETLIKRNPKRGVCLVDFQQKSQLNASIPMSNIVGIIDHHALQSNTIITEKPIFVDIRPWGSMSTIVAHSYVIRGKYLPQNVAGLLLSAILSDTLNLRSPTTTSWDERLVAMLVQYVGMEDVNEYAAKQFRAKSHDLDNMTPYELIVGDMKQFKFESSSEKGVVYTIGYSVIETTNAASSLARCGEIIEEMREVREEKGLAAELLAIVDIINLTSTLLICGPVEVSLAVAAYGDEIGDDGSTLVLEGMVSRKKDFVPPLTRAVKEGWRPPRVPKSKSDLRRSSFIVMDYSADPDGKLVRKFDD